VYKSFAYSDTHAQPVSAFGSSLSMRRCVSATSATSWSCPIQCP